MNLLTGGQRLCADCQVLIWLCRVLVAYVSRQPEEPLVSLIATRPFVPEVPFVGKLSDLTVKPPAKLF